MRYWRWIFSIILCLLLTSIIAGVTYAQAPPAVTTNDATDINSDSATLNGDLTSRGDYEWVLVSFEWGDSIAYGNETTPGNTTSTGPFSFSLSSLTPGTTYHFKAKAAGNGTDIGYGEDMTFTTGTPPSVTTDNATNITADSAILNGNLNSLGNASSVQVYFQWGLTTSYGNETTPQTMTTTGPFSDNLSSLVPGTTYHFRAFAEGNDTAYGDDMAFATSEILSLEGWGWCTNYNKVVVVTFSGYTTMVERANATNSYSMHTIGNLTLPSPYDETIALDMYGSRVRSLFYLHQEVTGKSASFRGSWIDNASGNESYIGMAGTVALPNPEGESLKTARICFALLRTPDVEVPLTEPGSFVQDVESMLTRFVKLIDKVLDSLIGTGFSDILSNILVKTSVLLAHLRSLGVPYIP